MATLIVTITPTQTTDWDDNPITVKVATSTIDAVDTTIIGTYDNTMSDQDVTTNYEAQLTAQGFTWSN